ncbi:unnamed protein product [Tuber melanosporum]|uniref:(Perigord truffle) hypothetical protein n=1 Tax=Tuber melanosporum (strain Mel28) TaxID=656061 RepID=D5GML1_TUBMM|nr:uncharacterized protein GSTUM_00010786001 [Tuber melanosporum]CAZ85754.1 unnamed protein product [Tuber melanosporum]
MEESGAGPPLSAAQIETSKEGRKHDSSKTARSSRVAKRSVTDGSIETEGFGRVASEWRVAKGRSKTMHNVITLSDDEGHFAQEIPEKKKKKAARQRKSATISESAKKGAKGATASTKKGKGKGKAVVNDSEDDGAFSDEAFAHHPISSPNNAVADEIAVLHPGQTPGRKRPGDQVMIAVSIESPPKPVRERGSITRKTEEINPPADVVEPDSDFMHENPQHDYESAPSSPKPVIPAKRAASGVSAGKRKKKTKPELEDEEENWDEKLKETTKKAAVKSRNAKVLDTAVIEDKAGIGDPLPKPAVRGRAAKAKVARKLPVEDEEEEAVEENLEEVEETPAALKAAARSNTTKVATTAGASETEDKRETPALAEPGADTKFSRAETETTPAPPERKSATPASASKKPAVTTPGRVPFRVGLSRKSKIPSLLKGFRK